MRAFSASPRFVVQLRSLINSHAASHLLFVPAAFAIVRIASHTLPSASHVNIVTRSVKTKSTVKLDDLPQGLIPLEPLSLEPTDDAPVYPTVVQQAHDHMRKFDNCVLLTRVGGFYELYFEHADEYGPLLNLKVASRKPSNAPAFSMVSIFHISSGSSAC